MRLSLPTYRKVVKCPEVKDNLMERMQYIDKFLENLSELGNWKWGQGEAQKKYPLAKRTRGPEPS